MNVIILTGQVQYSFPLSFFFWSYFSFTCTQYTVHIGHQSNVVVVSQFSVLIKWKEKIKIKKKNSKTLSMEHHWRRIACKTEWTRINIKFIRIRLQYWIKSELHSICAAELQETSESNHCIECWKINWQRKQWGRTTYLYSIILLYWYMVPGGAKHPFVKNSK